MKSWGGRGFEFPLLVRRAWGDNALNLAPHIRSQILPSIHSSITAILDHTSHYSLTSSRKLRRSLRSLHKGQRTQCKYVRSACVSGTSSIKAAAPSHRQAMAMRRRVEKEGRLPLPLLYGQEKASAEEELPPPPEPAEEEWAPPPLLLEGRFCCSCSMRARRRPLGCGGEEATPSREMEKMEDGMAAEAGVSTAAIVERRK